MHLGSLQDKRSTKTVRSALEVLPKGSDAYDAAYADAMERIQTQPKGDVTIATRALSWITKALRRISPEELIHALAVEPEELSFDEERAIDIGEVLDVCVGLVKIEPGSNTIGLVHYTTYEFLERHQNYLLPNVGAFLATTCLIYLADSAILGIVEPVKAEDDIYKIKSGLDRYIVRCKYNDDELDSIRNAVTEAISRGAVPQE